MIEPAPLVEVALHLLLQLPLDDGAVRADIQPDLLMLQLQLVRPFYGKYLYMQ